MHEFTSIVVKKVLYLLTRINIYFPDISGVQGVFCSFTRMLKMQIREVKWLFLDGKNILGTKMCLENKGCGIDKKVVSLLHSGMF